MNITRNLGGWVLGIGWMAGLAGSATAAPWDLLSASRIEARSDKTYSLSEKNGPWMIMACSFGGAEGKDQAQALVLELRKRYKMSAYSFVKKFEFADETFGRPVGGMGNVRRHYQRGAESEEIAVVVGDFPSIDDPQAQRTLRELKSLRPECLELHEGAATSRTLAAFREIYKNLNKSKRDSGPLAHAFLTPNPLLPPDYYAPKGLDKFVESMNLDNPYSLLNCPGKYTVQVACFHGRAMLEKKAVLDVDKPQVNGSKLVEAGEKAEKLTDALRQKGYEAYVFHDRYASLVTVGSFNSVGTPQANGQIEINPQIYNVMKTFGADPVPGGAGMKPKEMVGILFDIQPIPVEVPKRSLAADYQHDATRVR